MVRSQHRRIRAGQGRIAIVTDAGRDAVDAAALGEMFMHNSGAAPRDPGPHLFRRLSSRTGTRHNMLMELAPRLHLMNWLVGQGLTGLAENDLVRGFCERCRAGGLELSRGLVFIDTLHPIFEGRGFRWTDTETNESDT